MASNLGSTFNCYALGSLPTFEFCHIARNFAFIFFDIELDIAYIKGRD